MSATETALPFDVETELLDSLHVSLRALGAGTFGVAAVILICAYASGDPTLIYAAYLPMVAAIVRFVTALVYCRVRGDFDAAALGRWKIATVVATSSFAFAIGVCGLIGLIEVSDASVTVPLVAVVIGYAASSASRNAGVPVSVKSQLVLSVFPVGVGFAVKGGASSYAIAFLLFLATGAMIDISRSVYETLVRALTLAREKQALAEALSAQAANFDAALTNMSHGLAMFDADDRLVICNPRFVEFFRLDAQDGAKGASPAQVVGRAASAGLIAREDIDRTEAFFAASNRRRAEEDMALPLCDGRIFELSVRSMANGGAVVIVDDITERKAQEAKIARMARFDKLTGLPNRAQFEESFAELLADNARGKKPFAVVCIDLDNFKEVNDTLTHMVGDQLLVAVASRLRTAIRSCDRLARFGGDEFVLLLPSFDEAAIEVEISAMLQRLIEVVAEPYEIDSHAIVIGMSAGVAMAPADGRTCDDLLRAADLALYKAKQQGGGAYHFFESSLDASAQERRQIILDMRQALAQRQFTLEYQPIIDTETGRIAACEALMRWRRSHRRIEPEKFIAIAEETGMIAELGRWALLQACRDAVDWPEPAAVAVNLSPVQFKRDNLLQTIAWALNETGLDPHRLELEITENLLISGDETTHRTINDIVGLGCKLALDDFGKGYSTFSYLIRFPFRKVKLDKAFIDRIESRPDHRAIIGAMGQLARSLNISIVAEGVETASQLEVLVAEQVRYAQGWLFSKATAAADIPWKKFKKPQGSATRAA